MNIFEEGSAANADLFTTDLQKFTVETEKIQQHLAEYGRSDVDVVSTLLEDPTTETVSITVPDQPFNRGVRLAMALRENGFPIAVAYQPDAENPDNQVSFMAPRDYAPFFERFTPSATSAAPPEQAAYSEFFAAMATPGYTIDLLNIQKPVISKSTLKRGFMTGMLIGTYTHGEKLRQQPTFQSAIDRYNRLREGTATPLSYKELAGLALHSVGCSSMILWRNKSIDPQGIAAIELPKR